MSKFEEKIGYCHGCGFEDALVQKFSPIKHGDAPRNLCTYCAHVSATMSEHGSWAPVTYADMAKMLNLLELRLRGKK